jgi:hypothetical protein
MTSPARQAALEAAWAIRTLWDAYLHGNALSVAEGDRVDRALSALSALPAEEAPADAIRGAACCPCGDPACLGGA